MAIEGAGKELRVFTSNNHSLSFSYFGSSSIEGYIYTMTDFYLVFWNTSLPMSEAVRVGAMEAGKAASRRYRASCKAGVNLGGKHQADD